MSEVPIIGLTGGVASGKSAVADILEEQGCFVSDSDMIAHEVAQNAAVRCRSLQRGECLVGIGRSKCPPDRQLRMSAEQRTPRCDAGKESQPRSRLCPLRARSACLAPFAGKLPSDLCVCVVRHSHRMQPVVSPRQRSALAFQPT